MGALVFIKPHFKGRELFPGYPTRFSAELHCRHRKVQVGMRTVGMNGADEKVGRGMRCNVWRGPRS